MVAEGKRVQGVGCASRLEEILALQNGMEAGFKVSIKSCENSCRKVFANARGEHVALVAELSHFGNKTKQRRFLHTDDAFIAGWPPRNNGENTGNNNVVEAELDRFG